MRGEINPLFFPGVYADYSLAHWKKIVIFAPATNKVEKGILLATVLYMNFANKKFKEKINDMAQQSENAANIDFKPYLLELYEEAMAKGEANGIEKGIEKGTITLIKRLMKSNPDWTDAQIAEMLQLDTALVLKARKQLNRK